MAPRGARRSGDGASTPRWTARRAARSEGRLSRALTQLALASGFDEGQNSKRAGRSRKGSADWQTETERLRGPAELARPCGGAAHGEGRGEARGAAERGRGQHVSLGDERGGRQPFSAVAQSEAGDWRACASRRHTQAGSLPDGGVRRFDRPLTLADRGF